MSVLIFYKGKSIYKAYDDLPLFLNMGTVAKVLNVSPSSGYELVHKPSFPVLRAGTRMVVPKEQFIRWVAEHTAGGERKAPVYPAVRRCMPSSCCSVKVSTT